MLQWSFFLKKFCRFFDIKNWLWKYGFGTFWWAIIHRRIVFKKKILWACWFLAKNSAFKDPVSLKFHDRTNISTDLQNRVSVHSVLVYCRGGCQNSYNLTICISLSWFQETFCFKEAWSQRVFHFGTNL